MLDGVIAGDSWFDDDVTPGMFMDELNAGTGDIQVFINSPGGDCIAASQIYTMLNEYKGNVTIKIDGIAASAASVIAMAGNETLMSPTSIMMIHNPFTIAEGNVDEFEKAIAMLNEVKESIINAYELKSGLSRAKISHLMDDETWLNAGKALELGFIDGILYADSDEADEDEDEDETLVVEPKEDPNEEEAGEEPEENPDEDEKKKAKTDNKKSKDTVVRRVPSYSFSLKSSNEMLMSKVNKLTKPEIPAGAVDVNQLMKRLDLIK